MRDYQTSTRDTVITIAIICIFLFIFRLWPLIVVVLFVGFCVLIKRILFPKKDVKEQQSQTKNSSMEVIDDQDLWNKKYAFATEKISCLVEKEYPNARWIWEKANWRESIQKDEEFYIRLNKIGEYKRAKIKLQDGFVLGMEILPNEENETIVADAQPQEPKKSKDDSARIAFEWVETHLLELNERCNEIIGQGNNELTLETSELPDQKCWEDICKELVKAGLEDVSIIPNEGIKILLN